MASWVCQTKECDHYGKSLKREKVEEEFLSLLKNVAPSHDLIQIVETMVDKIVTLKGHEHKHQKKGLQEQLQLTKRKIDRFFWIVLHRLTAQR